MSAIDDARGLLAGLGAGDPLGVWSSAGRANLIGEHTDYNEGFVLPFAIDRRTYAAVAERSDRMIRVASTFDPDPVEVDSAALAELFAGEPGAAVARGDVPEWAAYPLGVAWAALRGKPAPRGLDIAIASDVPVGAGLSSSAAIEGAAAAAFDELWSLGLAPIDQAKVGRTAENEAVGAPTGIMDQVSSIMGRTDAATFLDCRTLDVESVDLGFAREGLEVLV
ncbi:MAG: galactokinase, partial [Microbacterium sp.]